jgi:hypothetical protein
MGIANVDLERRPVDPVCVWGGGDTRRLPETLLESTNLKMRMHFESHPTPMHSVTPPDGAQSTPQKQLAVEDAIG